MANTLFTLTGGFSSTLSSDLEVYTDIDAESKPLELQGEYQSWKYKISKLVNVNAVRNSVR